MVKHTSKANQHRGSDGKSIVHWAVINDWDDVLQIAVSHANAKVNAMDHCGKTGLHYAAQIGLYKIARQLIRYGASARIQDSSGRTAVHTAAIEGFADVLGPLIHESDQDPNDMDEQKRSLIHWAASCDWGPLMRDVLDLPSIETSRRDHYGRTAIHVAALCGCPNVLRVLIDSGCFDVTQVDAFGNTALHLAARGQSLAAVETLLPYLQTHGNRINHWHQTALDVANSYGAWDYRASFVGRRSEIWKISRPAISPPRL